MARPQKDTSESLQRRLTIRCTQKDYNHLVEKSEEAKKSLSEYIRQMALNGKINISKGSVDFEVMQELKRSGNNLNQLTKRFHATGVEPYELRQVLDTHNRILKEVLSK